MDYTPFSNSVNAPIFKIWAIDQDTLPPTGKVFRLITGVTMVLLPGPNFKEIGVDQIGKSIPVGFESASVFKSINLIRCSDLQNISFSIMEVAMALRRRAPANNVRRVKTNTKNSWGFMVNQLGEIVQFESEYERRLLLLLLFNPKIRRVISQPLIIPYFDSNGKSHTYTPDYLAEYFDGGIEILEFSMSFRRLESSIREREIGAQKYCADQGYKYIVYTELDLPNPTYLVDLNLLKRFRPTAYLDTCIAHTVLSLLKPDEHASLIFLVAKISESMNIPEPLVTNTVGHMLWHRQLEFDPNTLLFIDGTINPKATVWRNDEQHP